jgi:NADH:ubiquinone oxidoreductase subunit 6 (subunit J)
MIHLVNNAYAASDPTAAFASVVDPIIASILDPLVMLMFAVAVVVFVWGIVEMLMHGDDATAREKGRNHMLGGIVGIVIMVSAWGIIYFISNTIGGK